MQVGYLTGMVLFFATVGYLRKNGMAIYLTTCCMCTTWVELEGALTSRRKISPSKIPITRYVCVKLVASRFCKWSIYIWKWKIRLLISAFQVEGLKRNEKYEVRIAAVSAKGEGKYGSAQFILNKKSKSIYKVYFAENMLLKVYTNIPLLLLTDGAAIVTISQQHYVIWKTDIMLPCKTVGDPMPYLTWNKFSQQVSETDR